MTENLDPGTATRAALGEEIARLRLQLVERDDAVKFMTRMRDKAEWERDAARRDLAAATTALQRIRDLCDEMARRNFYAASPRGLVRAIRAVLPAAGDGPAATGGETP